MIIWLDFCAILFTQSLFLIFIAHQKGLLKNIQEGFVFRNLVVGLLFGIYFDLIFGKFLGIFSYTFGFNFIFLVINGALSYGLFAASITLLRKENFMRLYFWTVALGVVYECANYFFPVWKWTFGASILYQETIVIFAAYGGLSLLMVALLSLTGVRFRALK